MHAYGIMAHNYTMASKPIQTLQLHYPMSQFLIINIVTTIIIIVGHQVLIINNSHFTSNIVFPKTNLCLCLVNILQYHIAGSKNSKWSWNYKDIIVYQKKI